jgi:hypothetical protein
VEIAWLWNASNRMEEDVQQVVTFLSKLELDRYAVLLTEDPSGLGSSLEVLSQADDAMLEKVGMPASPRGRLLTALRAEAAAAAALAAAARQTSSEDSRIAPASTSQPFRPKSGGTARPQSSEAGQWGCLGRAPPGWCRVTPKKDSLSHRVVQMSDACTGAGDDGLGGEVQNSAAAALVSAPPQTPSASSSVGLRQPTPLTQSRPNSEVSRPGSSHGSTERISCYHCYKQMLAKFAVVAEDPSGQTGPRHFCSEACASCFHESLEKQRDRERELSDLRASVLGGNANTECAC